MSPDNYNIRAAGNHDIDDIIEIWSAMMNGHETMDSRIQLAPGAVTAYRGYVCHHLANRDARVFVAEAEERIVGFGLIVIQRNLPMFLPPYYGYLSDLAVDETQRGRGIGRALVAAIVQWLRTRGIDSIQLQHYTENENAGGFWTNSGFTPFYRRMWRDI